MQVVRWFTLLFLLAFALHGAENRVKVAVIDTGLAGNVTFDSFLCKDTGRYDFTNTGLQDDNGHGTLITSHILAALDPRRVCVISLKFYLPYGNLNLEREVAALQTAAELGVSYVNISAGGDDPSEAEKGAINVLLRQGAEFTFAAGNLGSNFDVRGCNYFPACAVQHPRIHVVGATDGKRPHTYSNYGKRVTDWVEAFGGTSVAAAKIMNQILREKFAK